MKCISIIGWFGCSYRGYNFGTALQSYALLKRCCDFGFDARLLKFYTFRNGSPVRNVLKRIGILDFLRDVYELLRVGRLWPSVQDLRLRRWNQRHYKVRQITSSVDVLRTLDESHCLISGSDQIWNVCHQFSPLMFLAFEPDYGVDVEVRRISYASSIGTNDFPSEYKDVIRRYLSRFAAISAREEMAVSALAALTGRNDIAHVCDPSFLLSAEEWETVAHEETFHRKMPEKFLLCYILSDNVGNIEKVKTVAKAYGISDVVVIPSYENPHFQYPQYGCGMRYEHATPSEFLRLLFEASIIVTDSFHGMALSINLSRQFVGLLRFDDSDASSQNSRIYGLLGHYGLNGRLYGNCDFTKPQIIDYNQIKKIVQEDREMSCNWLVENIN